MSRPITARTLAAMLEVPGFPDPVDAQMRSPYDLAAEAVERAETALSQGQRPDPVDGALLDVFRSMSRRPVHPPANSRVSSAWAFLAEVGADVAEHQQVTETLEALAEQMRAAGHDRDAVAVAQTCELLQLAEDGRLPDELDAVIRAGWAKTWNGPPIDLAREEAARAAVGVAGGETTGFDRIAEVERTAINLGTGVGVRIEHRPGVPDPDHAILDPAALRTRHAFPAV